MTVQTAALQYMQQGYAIMPAFSYKMLLNDAQLKRLLGSRVPLDWLAYWLVEKLCKMPLRASFALLPLAEPKRALRWFERYEHANIILATGRRGNIVVLDVDFYRQAHKHLSDVEMPETRRVMTGRGEHYYFYYPASRTVTRRHLHKNFILGDTCNIVAPPSLHIVGKTYTWLNPETPMAPLPDCLATARNAVISSPPLIHCYRLIKYSCFIYGVYPALRAYFALRFARQRINDNS